MNVTLYISIFSVVSEIVRWPVFAAHLFLYIFLFSNFVSASSLFSSCLCLILLHIISMDNFCLVLSGSARFSASDSTFDMGNPQTQVHAHNIANDQMKAGNKLEQYCVDKIVSSSGISGSSGSDQIKASKKGDNKGVRKHRYAFQTRSQIDILDDGYRWRKYGQKIVKSSNFPRSYYKCTHKGCNVKKQIQRCSKDKEIVVTTYEGMHTHPIAQLADSFDHIMRQMRTYTTL